MTSTSAREAVAPISTNRGECGWDDIKEAALRMFANRDNTLKMVMDEIEKDYGFKRECVRHFDISVIC
jgi:hypothetical protein